MKGFHSTGLLLTIAVLIVDVATYSADDITIANIDQQLILSCDSGDCFESVYEWYELEISSEFEAFKLLNENSSELMVSKNVTSVEDVGGKVYKCCSCSNDCQTFKIGVTPVANLTISNENIMAGSSVTVLCTARSYPPANKSSYYRLTPLPNDTILSLLPNRDGVYFTISSAKKELHSGTYKCVVTVSLDGEALQSEQVEASLKIYNPPWISCSRNQTIAPSSSIEQSAILECAVKNPERDVKVWVNWTTADNKLIKDEHMMLHKDGIYYLLFYNATASWYICNLFTEYSSITPVDKKFIEIRMATYGLEDCHNGLRWEVFTPVLSIMTLLALIIIIIVFVCTKYSKSAFNFSTSKYSLKRPS